MALNILNISKIEEKFFIMFIDKSLMVDRKVIKVSPHDLLHREGKLTVKLASPPTHHK